MTKQKNSANPNHYNSWLYRLRQGNNFSKLATANHELVTKEAGAFEALLFVSRSCFLGVVGRANMGRLVSLEKHFGIFWWQNIPRWPRIKQRDSPSEISEIQGGLSTGQGWLRSQSNRLHSPSGFGRRWRL